MTAALLEAAVAAIIKEAAKRLAEHAREDHPDVGANAGKHELFPVGPANKVQLYSFKPDAVDPLRFVHQSGYEFRAGAFYGTDLGSIPGFLSAIVPRKWLRLYRDDFIEAYLLHDFICRFGWVWVRKGPTGTWRRMKMSKKQGDVVLNWVLSAPTLPRPGRPSISATRAEARAIYEAVRKAHAVDGE